MKARGVGVLALATSACTLVVDTSDLVRAGSAVTPVEAGAGLVADAGEDATLPVGAAADIDAAVLPAPIVADAFEREVASGLGDAELGGKWDAPLWSVTGGRARTTTQVGKSSHASLPRVARADVEVTVDCAAPELADGTGGYFYVGLRGHRDANYNMGLRVKPDGLVDLNLTKTIDGKETKLANVASFTMTSAEAVIRLRGTAVGTTIRVKAWKVGEPEPDWLLAELDADDPAVARSLDPYFSFYVSSGATAPHTYFADNYTIRPAQ